jgi:16S rRNA (cytidine1402-2'-O)-methyltransferase
MFGKLYIVATPIGNLKDMTLRALETLKGVDCILCEDTRVTINLLNHFEITTPTMSYHHHSGVEKMMEIREMLQNGKDLALVTDAGTPGVSDPGNILIEFLTQSETHSVIEVVSVPGASALPAALSVCGFPTDKLLFLGFPPHKNKRQSFFKNVAESEYTTVFFESNHRIKKALASLAEVLDPKRKVVVCRELTKKFETIYRGTISEVQKMNISEKGEFVVVVNCV